MKAYIHNILTPAKHQYSAVEHCLRLSCKPLLPNGGSGLIPSRRRWKERRVFQRIGPGKWRRAAHHGHSAPAGYERSHSTGTTIGRGHTRAAVRLPTGLAVKIAEARRTFPAAYWRVVRFTAKAAFLLPCTVASNGCRREGLNGCKSTANQAPYINERHEAGWPGSRFPQQTGHSTSYLRRNNLGCRRHHRAAQYRVDGSPGRANLGREVGAESLLQGRQQRRADAGIARP